MTPRAPTRAILAAATALACLSGQAHAEPKGSRCTTTLTNPEGPVMGVIRIRLSNGESVSATLGEGEAARAFRAMLPLTLELTDYNQTEKIVDLLGRLPTSGELEGIAPEPGDLAYYAPWGNLALFYKDFGCSRGLVRLGRLDRIPGAFRLSAPVTVTIEAETAR